MTAEFKEKLKTINFGTGVKKSMVTDDAGNVTTEHDDGRVDVELRPKTVEVTVCP